jgi:RNA polymerase sigma-70 factor (ECF subfamily)
MWDRTLPRQLEPKRIGSVFVIRVVDTVSSVALSPHALASSDSSDVRLAWLAAVRPGAPEPPASEVRVTKERKRPRREPLMKPTDRDLVDRARGGDSGAFGELVRRHQGRIHRLAVHMLRDRAEAEDVTQETFIRAYNALARFDGRSEPYTWFYRITINLSLNRIRSRKTARTTHDTDDPRLDGVLIDKRPESGDPGTAAQRRELYTALSSGIDQLSDTLRTTLILVCIDGRSHEEVAAILGAPEGTIAWRIHEARRKLKEFMEARGFDPEGDGT